MVSAELAVALPALVLVLALGLAAVRLGIDRVRVVDAANVAARLAARGEPRDVVLAAAARVGPPGAVTRVTTAADRVHVVVTVPPPALLRGIGVMAPSESRATARLEGGTGLPAVPAPRG